MIVAKNFKWEAAHRLPGHAGKCKDLHGHSYKMTVELEGETDAKGMVVDFNEIKKIMEPVISSLDHTTIIAASDSELREVFESKSWKHFLLPADSTAENLCNYFLNSIIEKNQEWLKKNRISSIGIKLFETDTAYAYSRVQFNP